MPKHDDMPQPNMTDAEKAKFYLEILGQIVSDAGGHMRVIINNRGGRLHYHVERTAENHVVVDIALVTPRKQ